MGLVWLPQYDGSSGSKYRNPRTRIFSENVDQLGNARVGEMEEVTGKSPEHARLATALSIGLQCMDKEVDLLFEEGKPRREEHSVVNRG